MKKKIIEKVIFSCSRDVSNYSDNEYTWGEVQKILSDKGIVLQDTDKLAIGLEDEDNYGDSFTNACYYISVTREVEESDEEFAKRVKYVEGLKERNLQSRRAKYEELKKEFEGATA